MTDVSYSQVITRLPGRQADAEVVFRCGSDGVLSYIISTFDKDGQPAAMRMNEVGPSFRGPGYAFIRYEIRAGSAKSISMITYRPQYNNQVSLIGRPRSPDAALLFDLAGSDTGAVRLQMPNGDETFQWVQAVEPFMSTVRPCLETQQSAQTASPFTAKDAGEPKM